VDLKQIKELMAAMRRAGLKRISLKEKTGFEIELECFDANPQVQTIQQIVPAGFRDYHPPMTHETLSATHHQTPAAHKHEAPREEAPGKAITAPMVGTFYASPSPDKAPYVKVGDKVDAHTVVCIIEAMKVMNEIKAECKGVIVDVMAENAKPVEFGQKLFAVRPK